MVIWIFGQPGAGKSTLAKSVAENLEKSFGQGTCVLLDGDDIRAAFSNNVYGREGREANISRGATIAKYLQHTGKIVICSFITPYKSMRYSISDLIPGTVFVYLKYSGVVRGREAFHVSDFQPPDFDSENYLQIDTSKLSEAKSASLIALHAGYGQP